MTRILLLSIFTALVATSQLIAQSCFTYTDNYAVYTDVSSDATNIYTSVLVDGSGTMDITGGEGCSSINYGSAVHTPMALNVIATDGTSTYVGGPVYGPGDCPDCYLSVQNNQQVPATPGISYTFNSEGSVTCNFGGMIFSSGGWIGLRIGVTTYRYGSVAGGICTYPQFCGESTATCGADNLTKAAPCTANYYIADFLVVRVGVNSSCVPIAPASASPVPATCQ